MSVRLRGVHLTDVYLMGVYLMGAYLMGVYLTGVHLIWAWPFRAKTRMMDSSVLASAHAAQGGVTLGPEQGGLGANFCYLGVSAVRATGRIS